ncbi:MAG TPA: YpdA family putative bacillithiol disulfide reductase [Longimicrobiales bacterium]|nr:YpdA family putative bacillithiol disulfide reductase [Longimicrobiales bacterium]
MIRHRHAAPLDMAVIGAGPCGLAAGIAARRAQLSCVLFDKECVAASISRYPTHMTFFSTAERLEIGGVPFVVAGEKPSRREALRYYQRLAREYRLDIHQYEPVRAITARGAGFDIETAHGAGGTARYRARNVVIATGYFDSPNRLGIPGEDSPHVAHNYREGHVFYDQDCVVIGGGNSAVDAALELNRWGARVTLVHFAEQLDPNVKPWVRPEIDARIRDGDIAALFRARVTEIRAEAVVVHGADGERTLDCDWVLAMTGYTPDGTLLRSLGVEFDPETGIPHHHPGTMETNVPGVFIAGVLAAGFNANKVFIENGRDHGDHIVARVKSRVDTLREPG